MWHYANDESKSIKIFKTEEQIYGLIKLLCKQYDLCVYLQQVYGGSWRVEISYVTGLEDTLVVKDTKNNIKDVLKVLKKYFNITDLSWIVTRNAFLGGADDVTAYIFMSEKLK